MPLPFCRFRAFNAYSVALLIAIKLSIIGRCNTIDALFGDGGNDRRRGAAVWRMWCDRGRNVRVVRSSEKPSRESQNTRHSATKQSGQAVSIPVASGCGVRPGCCASGQRFGSSHRQKHWKNSDLAARTSKRRDCSGTARGLGAKCATTGAGRLSSAEGAGCNDKAPGESRSPEGGGSSSIIDGARQIWHHEAGRSVRPARERSCSFSVFRCPSDPAVRGGVYSVVATGRNRIPAAFSSRT